MYYFIPSRSPTGSSRDVGGRIVVELMHACTPAHPALCNRPQGGRIGSRKFIIHSAELAKQAGIIINRRWFFR